MKLTIPQKNLEKILKKYGIKAAYLFGSQADGKTHANSDIDIAVRFSKKLPLKQFLLLENDLTRLLGKPADVVNLDEAPLPLQFRVFRARALLYAKNPKEEVLLRAQSLSIYHDYQYGYRRFQAFEMNRILKNGLVHNL